MSCRCYVGDVWGKHIPKKGRANLKLWERTRWLEQREEEGEWEERMFQSVVVMAVHLTPW